VAVSQHWPGRPNPVQPGLLVLSRRIMNINN
jgi:hypothetical protein